MYKAPKGTLATVNWQKDDASPLVRVFYEQVSEDVEQPSWHCKNISEDVSPEIAAQLWAKAEPEFAARAADPVLVEAQKVLDEAFMAYKRATESYEAALKEFDARRTVA